MKIYSLRIIWVYIVCVYFTSCGYAFAQESKPLMGAEDITKLKDVILALPGLGTTGIILFLVSVVVAFGVWWWWKGYARKVTHRENEKQRRRDQAENKIENQGMTNDWDDAHDTVETVKKDGEDPNKPPRPKPSSN